jgi:hypothetical protein
VLEVTRAVSESDEERARRAEGYRVFRRQFDQGVEEALETIRVSRRTDSRVAMGVWMAAGWPAHGGVGSMSRGWPTPFGPQSPEVLSPDECVELERLASALQPWRRHMAAALSRFSLAHEHSHAGHETDRVIDLVIAAEALFLDKDHRELRYRLAMHAAFYLEPESPGARRAIYDLFRRAYDARSSAVHGGGDSNADVSRELEDAMRRALLKMSTETARNDLADWATVIVGPRPQ